MTDVVNLLKSLNTQRRLRLHRGHDHRRKSQPWDRDRRSGPSEFGPPHLDLSGLQLERWVIEMDARVLGG